MFSPTAPPADHVSLRLWLVDQRRSRPNHHSVRNRPIAPPCPQNRSTGFPWHPCRMEGVPRRSRCAARAGCPGTPAGPDAVHTPDQRSRSDRTISKIIPSGVLSRKLQNRHTLHVMRHRELANRKHVEENHSSEPYVTRIGLEINVHCVRYGQLVTHAAASAGAPDRPAWDISPHEFATWLRGGLLRSSAAASTNSSPSLWLSTDPSRTRRPSPARQCTQPRRSQAGTERMPDTARDPLPGGILVLGSERLAKPSCATLRLPPGAPWPAQMASAGSPQRPPSPKWSLRINRPTLKRVPSRLAVGADHQTEHTPRRHCISPPRPVTPLASGPGDLIVLCDTRVTVIKHRLPRAPSTPHRRASND